MSSEKAEAKRGNRFVWVFVWNAALIVALLAGMEFVFLIANQGHGVERKPFLINLKALTRDPYAIRQVGTTTKLSFLDPHLGFAHDHDIDARLSGGVSLPGFVVYGNPESSGALRIVALGGSTTDPLDSANWPSQLHDMLKAEGVDSVVFNGGVSGYTSNQELLKLIRDVLPMAPHLVISLSGTNDMAFIHASPEHPMVHRYQQRLLETIANERVVFILPNLRARLNKWRESRTAELERITGINYGPQVRVNDAQQWARNLGHMNALCRSSGVQFVGYLQPILGVGEYEPSDDEQRLIEEARKLYGPNYVPLMREFFGTAGIWTHQTAYAVDLTNIFRDHTDVYRDQRHPNAQGYKHIAEAIRDDLRSRGLLPAGTDSRAN